MGSVELLSDTSLTEPQGKLANTVKRCGELLMAIFEDILTYSRLEAANIKLEIRKCNLIDCANNFREMMLPLALAKKIKIEIKYEGLLPKHIMGDILRIKQILFNLTSNAVKFSRNDSIVTIGISVTDQEGKHDTQMLKIRVSDTGIGMTQQSTEKLFKPFSV